MSNIKKEGQLQMSFGKANGILRKSIIFDLLKQLGKNYCFRCGVEIERIEDLSIDHKAAWLDSEDPKTLFFDINNIAFSHLSCNTLASRKPRIKKHPSVSGYKQGCKCEGCIQAMRDSWNKYDLKRRNKIVG